MRVLINGSSGQIGTNLALKLQNEGHSVFGIDIRQKTWTDKINTLLQELSTPYQTYEHGIGHVEYPNDFHIVVHLAAHAKVHEFVEQPDRALENITMAYNVLEYCRHHNTPLIFSSSREVYGDIHRYITEESHDDFAFTAPPYSASKILGEALVYSYAQSYSLPYMVFRFSNVYGRLDNDIDRMKRVIPLLIKWNYQGDFITVFEQDKVLDFTYLDDCVIGIVSGIDVLASGADKNHTINLAFGEGRSLVDMANYVDESLNIRPNITIEPSPVGEVTHNVAKIAKAKSILNYNPSAPLKDGIAKSIDWSKTFAKEQGQS
jgi:UDP-glucuronate 4-epimerase